MARYGINTGTSAMGFVDGLERGWQIGQDIRRQRAEQYRLEDEQRYQRQRDQVADEWRAKNYGIVEARESREQAQFERGQEETYGTPVDELDAATGKPVRARYGNRGARMVVPDAAPLPKKDAASAPYYTPMQTSEGLFRFDARTGRHEPLTGGQGRQLMSPSVDPTVQGAVAAAKSEGAAKGKYAGSQPKILATMRQTEAKTDRVVTEIDKALGMVNGMTAGLAGTALSRVPGSDARNLQRVIDTIRANIGFAELNEMRANSPTGGALGQVTERELGFLQSVLASLEQDQSPAQLSENLAKVREALMGGRERLRQAYEADFGGGGQVSAPDGAPSAGTVDGGYRFKGGDPSDPANWEKAQ